MSYRSNHKPYVSPSQRRARSDRRAMAFLIAIAILTIGAMLYGMAAIDAANGISVSQSLESVGL